MGVTIEKIVNVKDKITTHGRVFFERDSLLLGWSASGFSVKFFGTSVAISFLPYSSDDAETRTVAVKLSVDGVATKATVSDGGEVVFADGFEDCEHTLSFFKISESHEPIYVSEIAVTGKNPEIKEHRIDYKMKLEVIGDSITCGYGIVGSRDIFVPHEEDATLTYAWRLGERLNAETRLISWSGKGLVKSCSGLAQNRFSDFHGYKVRNGAYGEYENDGWCPDLVVVNGGTNDQNSGVVTDGEFYDAARAFYNRLRGMYPLAKIVFFFGAMGDRYDKTYRSLIGELSKLDSSVYYLPTAKVTEQEEEIGANGHPNVKANERLLNELYEFVSKIIN